MKRVALIAAIVVALPLAAHADTGRAPREDTRPDPILHASILLASGAAGSETDDRAAGAMIARGLELRRQGKPAEALEMFQRAHAITPSARTLGQMGLVEGTLEHWTDAEDHLTAALAAADDPWIRKNKGNLQSALDSVKPHIGQLVFSGTPGAAVTVAGKVAGTLPNVAPVRVAAGTVLVSATASGSKQFVDRITVQGGMQTAVTITLQPFEPPPAPAPTAPFNPATVPIMPELHPHYSWKTWTGGGLLAVGAGLLTWGIVWIAVDGNHTSGACSDPALMNCAPVYDTKTIGWILTAGGAAAAAGGGLLLYTSKNNGTDITMSLAPTSFQLSGRF
jgi:hypothetical protein